MRNYLKATAILFLLSLSILCLTAEVFAQNEQTRRQPTVSRTFRWQDLPASGVVKVDLSDTPYSTGGFIPDKVTLESLPSRELLDLSLLDTAVVHDGHAPQLIIKMRGHAPSDPADDRLKVTVRLAPPGESFAPLPAIQQATKNPAAELEANLESLRKVPEIVRGWLAYAKPSREKHLYVSPSISAPGGGGSELGVHPVLYSGNILKMNRPINQIDFGLDMDKGSSIDADSNFANLGFNFRKIIPLQRKRAIRLYHASKKLPAEAQKLQVEAQMLNQSNVLSTTERARQESDLNAKIESTNAEIKTALADADKMRQFFFRALVITPFSPRLEMNLKALKPGPVNNFINNTELQLRTGTRTFISDNFDWSLKLIPVGLEAGVNWRNKDNPTQKGHSIFRLNTGFVTKMALHFPCHSDIIANRIQLEVKAMNRHLLQEESAFDRITKRSGALVHGNRYTFQADFKYVFGFITPIPKFRRRPALTLTYKNGFFPPVYSFNNAVTFHVTLESDDNDNASDIKAN